MQQFYGFRASKYSRGATEIGTYQLMTRTVAILVAGRSLIWIALRTSYVFLLAARTDVLRVLTA